MLNVSAHFFQNAFGGATIPNASQKNLFVDFFWLTRIFYSPKGK